MNIELNSEDLHRMPPDLSASLLNGYSTGYLAINLSRMPPDLSASLLNWLQHERLKPSKPTAKPQPKSEAEQLTLNLFSSGQVTQKPRASSNSVTRSQDSDLTHKQARHTHVRMSELFNAGFTREGMAVRVKLKQELAKKRGHEYVTRGLAISSKGTVIYNGQEFDKPSPLAKQINGSNVNGWEYVEVMKNGQWVCLDKLREKWRKAL